MSDTLGIKRAYKRSRSSSDQINALRWIIAALILAIIKFIFDPLWFPQAGLEYDLSRIFILGVAFMAVLTAYILYKRELKHK